MQREKEGRNDLSETFRRFGSFGSRRTMMPSLFGDRDPFDDPFFTRPYVSLFESSIFDQTAASREKAETNGGKGIVIEELTSDGMKTKQKIMVRLSLLDQARNHQLSIRMMVIMSHRLAVSVFIIAKLRMVVMEPVTLLQKTRGEPVGVVIEERKKADRTTGQATHRISRGIHDKGHSVTRKLNSDGKVDTTQTLHNLNEDELAEFEEAWEGKSQGHCLVGVMDLACMQMLVNILLTFMFSLSISTSVSNVKAGSRTDEQMGKAVWDNWRLPFREQALNARGQGADTEARTNSGGRTKKIVRINIE
ncbi:hypothetical protein DITRI_Ditri13aG0023200 [Diplodiscus trichospermus]